MGHLYGLRYVYAGVCAYVNLLVYANVCAYVYRGSSRGLPYHSLECEQILSSTSQAPLDIFHAASSKRLWPLSHVFGFSVKGFFERQLKSFFSGSGNEALAKLAPPWIFSG
jgi:hypothetical protein